MSGPLFSEDLQGGFGVYFDAFNDYDGNCVNFESRVDFAILVERLKLQGVLARVNAGRVNGDLGGAGPVG